MSAEGEGGLDPLSDSLSPVDLEGRYSLRVLTVAQAVQKAALGRWDVPEFQREFVWKPAQVCALADSLWRNYPIGAFLLWEPPENGHHRLPKWIADGQQRLTALCLLRGTEPSWFGRKPEEFRAEIHRRFDIRFDISANGGSPFLIGNDMRERQDDFRLLPVARLMAIDAASESGKGELDSLASELADMGCGGVEELRRRLSAVSSMRQREIVAVHIEHKRREDVLEVFERLNSRGMKFRKLLLKMAMEEIPAAIRGLKARFKV